MKTQMSFELFYKNKPVFPFDIQNNQSSDSHFMKYDWIVKCAGRFDKGTEFREQVRDWADSSDGMVEWWYVGINAHPTIMGGCYNLSMLRLLSLTIGI